jgi:dienelactone hydrolase
MDMYLSRIRAAISHVKTMPGVDSSNIALVGFGSGGTGAMYYALQTGVSDIAAEDSVKAIASFHGHLDRVAIATAGMVPENDSAEGAQAWGGNSRELATGSPYQPQILIQSGVGADSMKDIIQIESTLISLGANYELTRFSDTGDNFTVWGDENYNAVASSRSFDQLRTVLAEAFGPSSESGNDSYPEPQDIAEGDETTSSSSHVPSGTSVAIIAAGGLALVAF